MLNSVHKRDMAKLIKRMSSSGMFNLKTPHPHTQLKPNKLSSKSILQRGMSGKINPIKYEMVVNKPVFAKIGTSFKIISQQGSSKTIPLKKLCSKRISKGSSKQKSSEEQSAGSYERIFSNKSYLALKGAQNMHMPVLAGFVLESQLMK